MQLRAEQLTPHLAAAGRDGLRRMYTLWGDETLLLQEAADAVRAAARAAGHTERQVHTVAGAHFDWSGLLGAASSMSLFGDRQLVEIRIPSGKPGKDGSEALQRHAGHTDPDVITLVQLPRLDRLQQQSAWFQALDAAGVVLRFDDIDLRALPLWIAQRLARQGQRVDDGDAGRQTLDAFADRVEGNLLAAHQEIQKLALLYPPGLLTRADIEAAVADVARYDVFKLGLAVLGGDRARAHRMLDGLLAEGTAAPLILWNLAEDVRALKRVADALAAGKPMPLALREARVWGAKERLVERLAPGLDPATTSALLQAAHVCDGITKGLPAAGWPADPGAALKRLLSLVFAGTAMTPTRGQRAHSTH